MTRGRKPTKMLALLGIIQSSTVSNPDGLELVDIATALYGKNDVWAIEKTRGLMSRLRKNFKVAYFATKKYNGEGKQEWRYKILSTPQELVDVKHRLLQIENGIDDTITMVEQKRREAQVLFPQPKKLKHTAT